MVTASPDRSARRARVALLLLLGLAFAARLGWGMMQPADDAAIDRLPDQREYLTLARSLLMGRGLQFYDSRFGDTVYAFRTPGYPAFVAAFGARVPLVRAAQAAVDALTVLAVYLLARALLADGSRARALFAASLVAINPFLVYFSALLLTETLYTAMLVWGMVLLVVGGRGARLRMPSDDPDGSPDPDAAPTPPARPWLGTLLWLSGGALLALAILVRQSAAAMPLLLGIVAAFVNRPRADAYHPRSRAQLYRWPLPVGTTMVLLTGAALLPWAARNHRVVGHWVWTTTNGGVTLYDGFNPDADGSSNQSFLKAMPYLSAMGEVGRSQYLEAEAQAFVREHPQRAAQLAVIKAGRTWSPVPLSGEFGSRRNRIVAAAYFVPFVLLVLLGLSGSGLGRSAKVFVLVPAIYVTAVHMLTVGSMRYRIPVEPPLAVAAAAALARRPLEWRRAGGEEVVE